MTAAMQLDNKGLVEGREKVPFNLLRVYLTLKFVSQMTGLPISTVRDISN